MRTNQYLTHTYSVTSGNSYISIEIKNKNVDLGPTSYVFLVQFLILKYIFKSSYVVIIIVLLQDLSC